jgi:protein-tyrosine phosphatase
MEDTRVNLNGVLNVSLAGNDEETLSTVTLHEICSFIEERVQRREAVLICSSFGTNRSAAVALAFLIHHNDISLRDAYRLLHECVRRIRPNRRYLEDLLAFEQSVHGVRTSAADIDMLAF